MFGLAAVMICIFFEDFLVLVARIHLFVLRWYFVFIFLYVIIFSVASACASEPIRACTKFCCENLWCECWDGEPREPIRPGFWENFVSRFRCCFPWKVQDPDSSSVELVNITTNSVPHLPREESQSSASCGSPSQRVALLKEER